MPMTYCKECLKKQQKINELEGEIIRLKGKLRYQERTAKEGFFGPSTPSSKLAVKPNSPAKHQRNRGGGKTGHKGHGHWTLQTDSSDARQPRSKRQSSKSSTARQGILPYRRSKIYFVKRQIDYITGRMIAIFRQTTIWPSVNFVRS